jgi:hypothetical protein
MIFLLIASGQRRHEARFHVTAVSAVLKQAASLLTPRLRLNEGDQQLRR